jgi:hypothetical protein
MIADKRPIVVVANLFRNDPGGLVVRRDVAEARKLDAAMPLRARLAALKGATIGVAPAGHGRLRALFASQGLDLDRDVTAVVLLARDQGTALASKRVEALFVATPLLERAVVTDGAVVAANLARGELEELVRLYAPGVPATPEVRAEDLAPALALIPDPVPKPELAGIELAPFVASDLARAAATDGGREPRTRWGVVVVVVVGVLGIILVVRRRRSAGRS